MYFQYCYGKYILFTCQSLFKCCFNVFSVCIAEDLFDGTHGYQIGGLSELLRLSSQCLVMELFGFTTNSILGKKEISQVQNHWEETAVDSGRSLQLSLF